MKGVLSSLYNSPSTSSANSLSSSFSSSTQPSNPLPLPSTSQVLNQSFFCGIESELEYVGECSYFNIRDTPPIVFKKKEEDEEQYLLPHGKGVLRVREVNNPKYIEESVNGGVVSQFINNIYDGHWSKGTRDGEGTGLIQTHSNRGYHGSWFAKKVNPDIVVGKYKGGWKKGTLSGRGTLEIFNPPANSRIPPNSQLQPLTGEFENDNPWNCQGTLVTASGDWFVGEWVSGFFTGKCDKINSSMGLYRGEIRNDKKHGRGEEIDPMGGRYIGYFVQDTRHYTGRFVWPSGRVEEREYNNGALVVRTEVDSALQESLVKDLEEQRKGSDQQVQQLTQDLSNTKLQLKSLSSILESEKEANLCQICMEQKRNALIMPCCHFLYCNGCIRSHIQRNANNCPACRTPVGGIMECKLTLT